jgi:hypothetical protein
MNVPMKPSISRVVLLPCAFALGGLGGCGGQVVTVLATADGGSGQTGATSGSFPPGSGASASGNSSASGTLNASGSLSASGTLNASGSSNAGSSSGTGTSGSSSGTPGGSIDAGPPSRCGFAPDTGAAPASSVLADSVLTRIFRFLDDSSGPGLAPPPPPNVTAADWAGRLATSILDQHLVNKTEAPGLVRFLTAWLQVSAPDAGVSAAHTWSLKLLDPSATLTTLLAGPTGDPHRIGILTDPQVLTARPGISSRGQWMANSLWCSVIPASPAGLPPLMPPPPGLTRREALQNALSPPQCKGCHNVMDPPGYSLEHFDAMGNYRDLDTGKPVDSSGTLGAPFPMLNFTSIDDLAPQLAVSCPVAQCFAKLVMTDAFAAAAPGSMNPFTAEEANHVANEFANSNFSIRELVKAIVGTPSFLR